MSTTNQITTSYTRQDFWQEYAALFERNHLMLSGLPHATAQSFTIHQLMHTPLRNTSAVLWLVKTKLEQQKLQLLLEYWQRYQPHQHKPQAIDTINHSWLIPVLNKQSTLLLATYEDLATLVAPPGELADHIILKPGIDASIMKLRKNFVSLGFFENQTVQAPQDFAIRGDVIDLWPLSFERPIRILLDHKSIEKIYTYSEEGKKLSHLSSLVLPHMSTEQTQHPLSEWLEYFDVTITHFEDNELYQPSLPHIKQHIDLSIVSQDIGIDVHAQTWAHRLPASQLAQKFKQLHIELLLHTGLSNTTKLSAHARSVELEPFLYLENWYSAFFKTALISTPAQRVAHTSTKKQKLFTQNLKNGDFLVHQDHGLCRFGGMTMQEIDGIETEYLLLQFADNDRLYLPPYQINKVTKYIGEPNPKLNKLSGTSWLTTVKKIREETIHLAHDIIQLSAKRQLAQAAQLKNHPDEAQLADGFPHTLTSDQATAWQEVEFDLSSGSPMDRLLCGDVGFGKTELALRAAFKVVKNGGQVALLAPTTILVQQHFDVFTERLQGFGIKVGLLSRWRTASEQQETIAALQNQTCDIVIGTHRLLSNDVHIPNLQLLIIDEEQKFGVKHKERLKQKRETMHTLALSATPIPRTLHFSLSGLRDISLIQTPPPGRLPITTNIVPHDHHRIREAIEAELSRQGQVYYLVRKVQEIPGIMHAVQKLVPKARTETAHGQLPPKKLAEVMTRFDHGEIDVLICSTIIENGLDMPNANTLIVDNAAHFGLSQLYQLRGRIGRSSKQGYAYLLFHKQKLTGIAAKRLQALQGAYELGSGFDIAMKDLEIRGAGNLLGKEQHGQIAAVGLGLYTQLLNETIEQLAGQDDARPHLDVTIDLPIASTIARKTIPEDQKRLLIYQELAHETTEEALLQTADALLPKEKSERMENMIMVLRLKLVCERIGAYAVDSRVLSHDPFDAKITVHFSPDTSKGLIPTLIDHNDNWVFDGQALKIKTSNLNNKNWLAQLLQDLQMLIPK